MALKKSSIFYFPAQIRYNERNPIISFRIPKSEYDNLKQIAKKSGITLASLARKRVREASSKASDAEEAQEKGFNEGFQEAKKKFQKNEKDAHEKGYNEGFQEAKKKFQKNEKDAHEKGYNEGFQEAKKKFEAVNKNGIEDAYKQGLKEGRKAFEIAFPCTVCGQPITILPNKPLYKIIKEDLLQRGWKHPECKREEEDEEEGYLF